MSSEQKDVDTRLQFYEISQCEYTIESFIEAYQNELPQLVMIKKGYLGDTGSNSLDTGQVKSLSLSQCSK